MSNIILVQNNYQDQGSLRRTLNYILHSDIIGGYAIDPNHAFQQMCLIKRVFHKEDGVQLKHFIISFSNKDLCGLNFDEILDIGFWIGQVFCKYQMAFAVHTNADHVHLHIVMNTVSFLDGRKYSDGWAGFLKLRAELQKLFSKSNVGLFRSDPQSEVNRYSYSEGDYVLRIDR